MMLVLYYIVFLKVYAILCHALVIYEIGLG